MNKVIAIDINDTIRDNLLQFANVYKKFRDNSFDMKEDEFENFDLYEYTNFENRDAYNNFKYVDCAFELYGRAEPMEKMLPYRFNDWVQNTMKDFEEEDVPEIIFVSPFEIGLTIQATLSFLSKISSRVREYYFPVDSSTIWDKCDILITANPNLLSNVPEGKTAIKIKMPYNQNVECEYEFDNMMALINDEETIINLIEKQ